MGVLLWVLSDYFAPSRSKNKRKQLVNPRIVVLIVTSSKMEICIKSDLWVPPFSCIYLNTMRFPTRRPIFLSSGGIFTPFRIRCLRYHHCQNVAHHSYHSTPMYYPSFRQLRLRRCLRYRISARRCRRGEERVSPAPSSSRKVFQQTNRHLNSVRNSVVSDPFLDGNGTPSTTPASRTKLDTGRPYDNDTAYTPEPFLVPSPPKTQPVEGGSFGDKRSRRVPAWVWIGVVASVIVVGAVLGGVLGPRAVAAKGGGRGGVGDGAGDTPRMMDPPENNSAGAGDSNGSVVETILNRGWFATFDWSGKKLVWWSDEGDLNPTAKDGSRITAPGKKAKPFTPLSICHTKVVDILHIFYINAENHLDCLHRSLDSKWYPTNLLQNPIKLAENFTIASFFNHKAGPNVTEFCDVMFQQSDSSKLRSARISHW